METRKCMFAPILKKFKLCPHMMEGEGQENITLHEAS
jgi:hypothetical protein